MASLTAAATCSLTGQWTLQGLHAARGLRWWARREGIALEVVDDQGSSATAVAAYRGWMERGVDLVLGPYGSGLVRAVAPLVTEGGSLLWNHGGSADDLARPLVASVPAPASTYFHGAVELAERRGLSTVHVLRGGGRFAGWVAEGARRRAAALGLDHSETALARWSGAVPSRSALLVVGRFEEDVATAEEIGRGPAPGLLGCVAAGLPEFGRLLGPAAEGVVGPAQWVPDPAVPEVGPGGDDLAASYRAEHGEQASYVAAQAAAAGFLAAAAARRGYSGEDVRAWTTSTLLGPFALDGSWRQVGLTPTTVEWRGGRQRRVS